MLIVSPTTAPAIGGIGHRRRDQHDLDLEPRLPARVLLGQPPNYKICGA